MATVAAAVRLTTTEARVTLVGHCGNLPGHCEFDYTVSARWHVGAASNGAGDIRLHDLPDRLNVRSSNGNVAATGLAGTNVTASSGTGNVSLTFSRAPMGVHADSGTGDVTIAVPGGVTYAVAASAPAGTAHIGIRTAPSDSTPICLVENRCGPGDRIATPAG